jgi:D-alanyl-D-alanine-carboxypeptidase/D-alanyl-D-alanine-endopeptidase
MYEFLSRYTLTRDIGAQYEYSNFGTGLLGHILTLRADTDYENLVRTQICQPLGMDSTCITLSPAMKARLATGHNAFLRPVPIWNWGRTGMEGAGSLRSTANDLLKFIAANVGLKKTPLTAIMETTHLVQHDTATPNMAVGLGWEISTKFDSEIISHDGNTAGQSAVIAFDKKKRQGVVVLSNSYVTSINDIAFRILNDKYGLAKVETAKEHKVIKLDSKKFDPYVGEYHISQGPKARTIVISREEDRFFIQIDTSLKQELLAESETEFFIDRLAVTVTFVKDDRQQATNLVFNNDSKTSAKKIK